MYMAPVLVMLSPFHRYFDAARSYGKAEEFLGGWLRTRDIPTSDVVIGSKWGYTYTADWQIDTQVHTCPLAP